jgi:p-aminobenzoyl-glutamate transporter AbgT
MDRRQLDKKIRERQELNKLYQSPENKGLKYSAFAVIAVVILLQISIIIWMEHISYPLMLFLRGCIGLGAIIFVILVGILAYRVNTRHIQNRRNSGK